MVRTRRSCGYGPLGLFPVSDCLVRGRFYARGLGSRHVGDLQDYPHADGMARPLDDYRAAMKPVEGEAERLLYEGNIAWLMGAGAS